MDKSFRRLAWAVFLFTVLDAMLTVGGLRLGVITEGNPILRGAMHTYPMATAALVCAYAAALTAVVIRYGPGCRCIRPLLAVLCAVKAAVIILHIGWVLLVMGVIW